MRKTILASALCLILAVLWGCSSEEADLLKYASANDAVIITGSLSDVAKNAGCEVSGTKIKLTEKLQRLMKAKADRLDFGIDPDHCLLTYNIGKEYVLLAAPVKSQAILEKAIKTDDQIYRTRTERSGMVIYRLDPTSHIIIDDEIVFMVVSMANKVEDPDVVLGIAEANASSAPLASWQKDFLESDHTANLLISIEQAGRLAQSPQSLTVGFDPEEVRDGFVRLTADLDGPTLKAVGQVCSAEGKVLANPLVDGKPDTSMLRYATSGSMAIALAAIKPGTDWGEILRSALSTPAMRRAGVYADDATLAVATSVLNDLDGTVMLSVEPGNVMVMDKIEGWGVTLAARMKPGAAKKYADAVSAILALQGLTMTPLENGVTAEIPDQGAITVYADGDNFVASTRLPGVPRGNSPFVKAADFDGYNGGLVVNIPKSYPLLGLVGFNAGVRMTYMASPDQVTMETTLTGVDTPMLQSIIDMIPR